MAGAVERARTAAIAAMAGRLKWVWFVIVKLKLAAPV
jgi:hypothetical protein